MIQLIADGLSDVHIHYRNPVDLMSYSLVNFVTFLVSSERKCHICDIIVFNKLTLTQSKRITLQK